MPPEARALALALGLWLALRIAALALPGMWLWGLDVPRFLPVAPAIVPWLFAGAIVAWAAWRDRGAAPSPNEAPPAARALAREASPARRAMTLALAALGAAALVWFLPDRIHFTGDFALRQGTTSLGKDPALLFPQAMPLDVWLHYTLPRALGVDSSATSNAAARQLGAFEAALLALLASAYARALGARGPVALAAASCAFFGGWLGMFTGYGKGLAELTLGTLACGTFAITVARSGGGLLALGISACFALAAHRSGVFVLPAVLAAWIVWLARHARARGFRLHDAAGIALPVVSAVLLAPLILRQTQVLDDRHLLPESARRLGIFSAAFADGRALNLANLLALLAPLAPLALLALPWCASRFARRPEALVCAALAAPALAIVALVHPLQGEFRDWDVFAPAAMAIALASGAVVVAASERAPRWLALAALFAALVPSTQWVLHLNDERRALARVEAWIEGPPKPVAGARATTWDFVGMHEFVAARYDRAARAAERAVADAPNPRFYLQWGMADAMRGDYASAQARYRDAVRLNPDFTTAWVGLASASSMLDDVGECARASANIRRLDPANEHLAEIEDYLRRRGVEASR